MEAQTVIAINIFCGIVVLGLTILQIKILSDVFNYNRKNKTP